MTCCTYLLSLQIDVMSASIPCYGCIELHPYFELQHFCVGMGDITKWVVQTQVSGGYQFRKFLNVNFTLL